MINMVDMVIADIGGKPCHERIGLQMAGRFELALHGVQPALSLRMTPGKLCCAYEKMTSPEHRQS